MPAQAELRMHCVWQAVPCAAGPAAQGRIDMRSGVPESSPASPLADWRHYRRTAQVLVPCRSTLRAKPEPHSALCSGTLRR